MRFSNDWRLAFGAAAAVLTVSGRAAAQHMWTVDDNAPADFTTIQDAVNACANGDVVRVFAGAYAGFQITGKSVAVLGDSATPRHLTSPVSVTSTNAGQTVVVSGFTQTNSGSGAVAGITISGCAGAVRVQDCAWNGMNGSQARGGAGARVENSLDAILSNCGCTGGQGGHTYIAFQGESPYGGGHGIELSAAQAAVWGVNATSGLPNTSTTVYNLSGVEGGSGAFLDSSLFFASGTLLKGGQGGKHSLSPSYCVQANGAGYCGDAGAGLRFEFGPSSAFLQQPTITAGVPGTTNCSGWYVNGHPARPIVNHSPGSSATRVANISRTLTAPAFASGTTVVNLTVTGAPGDLVYAVAEAAPDFNYDAAFNGVWSLSYPPQVPALPDAVIPSSGAVSFPITLAAVPATQDVELHFVQMYVIDQNGQAFVSTPRVVTLAH